MYVILAPIQIKPGCTDQFIEAIIADSTGSVNNEPGCRRFDVIQRCRRRKSRLAL